MSARHSPSWWSKAAVHPIFLFTALATRPTRALEILDEARILPAEVSVRDCLGTHCGEKKAALSPRIGYSKVKMGLHQVQRRLEADDNCSTKYNAPWRFERGSAGLEAKSTPARIEA
ncbi:hypothetical protein CISG_01914 [Coccidioides immitis RMSCC 3703]|uniref:Uncharacterized protein n=1 Tax=Coccidioides immitis RMSCC 3703 TaxID=454286 RepID=A0A0J8R433_COCIT|nr:hypothetical protein CISG_01914 [Coccidioides immitis RMSCC 3703]